MYLSIKLFQLLVLKIIILIFIIKLFVYTRQCTSVVSQNGSIYGYQYTSLL